MSFDPQGILRTLVAHRVEFVVIGGIAGAALGSPTATVDIDICYRRTDANLGRLAGALEELNARLRGTNHDVPFLLDARTLAAGDHFTLTTDLGDLDLLGSPAGTAGFEDLSAGAMSVSLEGFEISVVSLSDLIRMKRAAGRPRDVAELEILEALREELVQEPDKKKKGPRR
jgi:predicted nucleotidyltransferase